ncbi:MAG: hypothetical protein MRZ79_16580 [Bacteroidia bacterium]|nr:hypothetical protein [Bacteroidia bacterium]
MNSFHFPIVMLLACLQLFLYSCDADSVQPLEEEECVLLGSWELGTAVLRNGSQKHVIREIAFQPESKFILTLGLDSLQSGNYIVRENEEGKNFLVLYVSKHLSESFLIDQMDCERIGLTPIEELGIGSTFYYVRK